VRALARDWDQAAFQIPDPRSELDALKTLESRATALAEQHPGAVELLAWKGIILSTKADASEGMTALGFAEAARKALEKAIAANPDPLGDGSIYAMLGALYHAVPGFPLGFGDKHKARKYLQKAVEQNPTGVDSNYFYGAFLSEQGQYKEAKKFLETALRAPPRPGRETGDKGRRADIAAQLREIGGKLAQQ
jgi:tetratricopeptide (TPR) repeat protein